MFVERIDGMGRRSVGARLSEHSTRTELRRQVEPVLRVSGGEVAERTQPVAKPLVDPKNEIPH